MFKENVFPQDKKIARITDDECDSLIDLFDVNDERDDLLNLAEAFFTQFWAHWVLNTIKIGNKSENLYRGTMTGHFGAYPLSGASSVLMKDGRFLLDDNSLPSLRSDDLSLREITPDEHRNNENRVLAAWHLTLARLHNKRMDVHNDYDKAFNEVVAAFNKAMMNLSVKMLETSVRDFLNVQVQDVHLSKEWAFQAGRFGHVLMPEKFGEKELFDKTLRASSIDMKALLDEDAGKIGMRISPPMNTGSEGGKGKPILFHTVKTRHNEQNLACWGDICKKYRTKVSGDVDECVPVFFGMLHEVENNRFGKVGSRMIADGIAGTLLWPEQGSQLGIYYREPDDVPCTVEDIIKEVW